MKLSIKNMQVLSKKISCITKIYQSRDHDNSDGV